MTDDRIIKSIKSLIPDTINGIKIQAYVKWETECFGNRVLKTKIYVRHNNDSLYKGYSSCFDNRFIDDSAYVSFAVDDYKRNIMRIVSAFIEWCNGLEV